MKEITGDYDRTLNENEKRVLAMLQQEIEDCTGGQFGYMPNVKCEPFTKHEFSGYVSQLVQKGIIEVETHPGIYRGQFKITQS